MAKASSPKDLLATASDLVSRLRSGDDLQSTLEAILEAARTAGWADAQIVLASERGGGAVVITALTLRAEGAIVGWFVPGDGGGTDAFLSLLAELAATAIMIEGLRTRSRTGTIADPVTGLAGRKDFEKALTREVRRAYRLETDLSVLTVEIDRYDRILETGGQAVADNAARSVADVLRNGLRQVDIAAHVGPSQFRILLPGTPGTGAREVAERLRCTLAATNVPDLGTITATIGVASLPEHAANGIALVHAADAAVGVGRRRGRNQVAVALPLS